MAIYKLTCSYAECSKDFEVNHRKKNNKYCCYECSLSDKRSKSKFIIERHSNCLQCNKNLTPSQFKFCSNSCSATYSNLRRTRIKIRPNCSVCGSPTRDKHSKYCSKICMGIDFSRRSGSTPEHRRIRRNEASARYRAQLRNQTPTDIDRNAIREFYANCPTGYEVDHIIPISKGGLHTLENLQYLTIAENRRKSNKL